MKASTGIRTLAGRWYFVTRSFRSHDSAEARYDLVDLGPWPARGTVAHIETRMVGRRPSRMLVSPTGELPVELAAFLLDASGELPCDLEGDVVSSGAPAYQEAAEMIRLIGRPADTRLGGLVGIARVLLELAGASVGSRRTSRLLDEVVHNLTSGVEDPDRLLPTE